jgi:hypothetical protein
MDGPNPGPFPDHGVLYDANRPVDPTTGGKLYWGFDKQLQEWTWRITQYGPEGHWSERADGSGGHNTPFTPDTPFK